MHEGDHDILEGLEKKDDHHKHAHEEQAPSLNLKKTLGIVALVIVVIVIVRFFLV